MGSLASTGSSTCEVGLDTAWLQQTLKTERIWEPLFVSITFVLWGWYVFWLYHACQDYTVVPWP